MFFFFKEREVLEVEEKEEERGNWTGKLDFLLSCLGYAVGKTFLASGGYRIFPGGGGHELAKNITLI